MNHSSLLAFFLSFIPGLGHLYLNRKVRGVVYGILFFGAAAFSFFTAFAFHETDPAFFFFVVGVCIWVINMLDMIFTLITRSSLKQGAVEQEGPSNHGARSDQERFFTIVLSLIPGLGHFHMGLMQRGLAFLMMFFGLIVMTLFVSFVTRLDGFLVFLFALPVIWLYGIFDAVQLMHRRQRGEIVEDRSIFDELNENRTEGKKSRVLATILAVFPGAGHMYLGLQRRGLQFMAAFLFIMYILDAMRLSLFMFLLPLIWFYSLFDALQYATKHGKEEIEDIPLVHWLMNHQKWIGYGLLALGAYYLMDNVLLRVLENLLPEWRVSYKFHKYFQTVMVSVILIGGGLWFLVGSKRAEGKVRR